MFILYYPILLVHRVPLANGGSLIIEQTEALVSIDVNGGHGVFGQETSQEKAILEVNLAAARQVRRIVIFYIMSVFHMAVVFGRVPHAHHIKCTLLEYLFSSNFLNFAFC